MPADYLLVADLETTGLDISAAEIIEAAFILVDAATLTELGRWERVLPPTHDGLAQLLSDKEVREMHVASGLLDDVALAWRAPNDPGPGEQYTDPQAFAEFVASSVRSLGAGGLDTVYLAGSGIAAFDRHLIRKHMPAIEDILHYAPFDVGVPRRMIKLWTGYRISADNDQKRHRAMSDADGHLNELRGVKKFLTGREVHTIYVPTPVP
jgi:oligoribonuclease (3'-5' exoribonuclease)